MPMLSELSVEFLAPNGSYENPAPSVLTKPAPATASPEPAPLSTQALEEARDRAIARMIAGIPQAEGRDLAVILEILEARIIEQKAKAGPAEAQAVEVFSRSKALEALRGRRPAP